ncbi:MAG: DNA gyrase subunit A [Lachnospiraceae bacterium]|nr:DNA gyrase subunit A [Lachnospiraceae bacterium]
MDDTIFDNIMDVDLKKTMETSYIDYAMSVIASRALPDVRDGLKPVQRRILFSMSEMNNGPDKPHRKSARIVGDTMGKYHPHGDSSIYGALVNMAQEWSTRYILVDGHGNFGSVDGDGAAAMRYTEARMSKISTALVEDLGKDTVDFIPNYDETEKEPVVMPARFPNLLVNGTTGIAVGMATNIPPHNLREVIAAVVKMIDNQIEEDRETEIEELLEIVKGPDFPTGGVILGRRGIEEAYRTGRGKIRVRAVSEIEPMNNGKNRIVVTELPYMVNKARLIENIADLVRDKKLDGITDLRDESSREGMRIVIELRKDVNPSVMLNQLYKHTQLHDTFGVIMLALVNNQPKILSLKQMLFYYLEHQKDVITRRTKYDLNKAKERAHLVEGYLIALDHIDEVINIIRSSANVEEARTRLMEAFSLSEAQARAIVEMRLRALTGLERKKLEDEYAELKKTIERLTAILGDEKLLLGVIKEEILVISEKYGDDRRTVIGFDDYDISMEDLIPVTNTVITFTKLGYIKRMNVDNFKSQHRGGKGIKGMDTIDDDYIVEMKMTTSHHTILFFTTLGRAYRLKAYEIPEASRISRGTAIVNLLPLQPDEKITSMITLKEFTDNDYLFMATRSGTVKRTRLSEYANIRKNGLAAIALRENDILIDVKKATDEDEALLFTKFGMCARFKITDARQTGRVSYGVRGMNLADGDEVIAMQLSSQGESVMIVSEKGLGKCTKIEEFPLHFRGVKGVKCYKITEKTGNLVGVKAVNIDDEMMLINTEGIIIRIRIADTALLSRITSGVKLINLNDNEKVASIAKVRNIENVENETEELEDGSSEESGSVNEEKEVSDSNEESLNSDEHISSDNDDSLERLLDAAEEDSNED